MSGKAAKGNKERQLELNYLYSDKIGEMIYDGTCLIFKNMPPRANDEASPPLFTELTHTSAMP